MFSTKLKPIQQEPAPQIPARTDWISVIAVSLSFIVAIVAAILVKDYGAIVLLLVPAGVMFAISVGRPEVTLFGFIFMIYTQMTTVLSRQYGLPSPAILLVALLVALLIIRIAIYNERPVGWLQVGPILLIYNLTWLASMLHAPDYALAFDQFLTFSQNSFGALLIVFFIQKPVTLRRAIWVLIAAGILMGTISAFQHLTGTFSNSYWGFGNLESSVTNDTNQNRSMGPYANPNAFAQVILVVVPLALDRLWNERNVILRFLAGWAAVVCVLTIFYTYSRGGLLSMLVGVAVLVMTRRPNILPMIVSAALAVMLLQYLPASYTERLGALTQLIPTQATTDPALVNDISFRGRLSENVAAWRMFLSDPLLGVGLGNFQVYYQDYARDIGLEHRRDQRTAASLYLELLAEQGLVGTLIFVVLLVIIFRGLLTAQRRFTLAGLKDYSYIATAMFAGLSGYMFAAINKNSAYSNVFWVLIGIALATWQVAETSWQESEDLVRTSTEKVA